MTARNGKCSKQESISGICVEGIQGEKMFKKKENSSHTLQGYLPMHLTEKCLKVPKKCRM